MDPKKDLQAIKTGVDSKKKPKEFARLYVIWRKGTWRARRLSKCIDKPYNPYNHPVIPLLAQLQCAPDRSKKASGVRGVMPLA